MSQERASRLLWSIGLLLGLLVVALAALMTPAYGYDNSLVHAQATAQGEATTTLQAPGTRDSRAALKFVEAAARDAGVGRYSYDDGANVATHAAESTGSDVDTARLPRRLLEATLASPGELSAPRVPVGALDDASQAAFRAADNIDDFTVPLKHQPWASGNYARFADDVDQQGLIAQALRSEGAMFLPNNRPGSFRVAYDFGQVIGTRGETALRVVVGNDGRIWTAFPVKP